jgi:hypothetical protein
MDAYDEATIAALEDLNQGRYEYVRGEVYPSNTPAEFLD